MPYRTMERPDASGAVDPVQIAQAIFDRQHALSAEALVACKTDTWAELVRAHAPPRPRLRGRLDYARCIEDAERSLRRETSRRVTLLPLWACMTDDAPSDQWVAVHGLWEGSGVTLRAPIPILERRQQREDATPRADAPWRCTVQRWVGKHVAAYDFDGSCVVERRGDFALVELPIDEVLAVETEPAEPIARPTHEAPPRSLWLAPRVRFASAELELHVLRTQHRA